MIFIIKSGDSTFHVTGTLSLLQLYSPLFAGITDENPVTIVTPIVDVSIYQKAWNHMHCRRGDYDISYTPITPLESKVTITLSSASPLIDVDALLKAFQVNREKDAYNNAKCCIMTIDAFKHIVGVGSANAMQLYNEGYRNLDDLKEAMLSDQQRIGLKWYADLQKRIPRAEIDRYREIFTERLKGVKIDVTGSYRRGLTESGDIDLLVCSSIFDIKTVVDGASKETPDTKAVAAPVASTTPGTPVTKITMMTVTKILKDIIVDVLSSGPKKFMCISKLPSFPARRFDIRVCTKEEWWYSLLYNTGPAKCNIMMRNRASMLGYHLNEYEMKDREKKSIIVNSEEEIFTTLGLVYLTPVQRSDAKKLERIK